MKIIVNYKNWTFFWIAMSLTLLAMTVRADSYTKPKLAIQSWNTSRGVQVVFTETHELPMLDLGVVFYAGAAFDGKKYGVANFTSAMLDAGTKTLTADQIAAKFDHVGAEHYAYVNVDTANVGMRCLTNELKVLNSALQTFATVLNEPIFPSQEFFHTQKQILASIQQQNQEPSNVADEEFSKKLYGDFPYSHQVVGNSKTVAVLKRKDLQEFYRQYYTVKNAIIVMVGDITRKQAEEIAEQITAKLPKGDTARQISAVLKKPQATSKHIEFPSTQTNVKMGQIGIARDDADYFPLYVGNYILGASPVSELFTEVREKLGLVYGIGSYFDALLTPGPFSINLSSSNEKAKEAIQVTTKTLKRFVQNGPTEEQLIAAKKSLVGQFPLRFSDNSGIANLLRVIGIYHLPLDYIDAYTDKINAVTLKQIQEAFKQHINLDDMVVVTVGKTVDHK